jgi:hypothetical protein
MARDKAATRSGLDQQLATELAELVLAQVAPEELVILDDTAWDYFADPRATLDPRRRDEPLGFGVDVTLVCPYVLAVAGPVVTYLGSLVADGVHDAATSVIADRVRRLFRRPVSGYAASIAGAAPEVALTPEQGRRIRGTTLERARALGLPDAQAGVLADAIVGSLIIRS